MRITRSDRWLALAVTVTAVFVSDASSIAFTWTSAVSGDWEDVNRWSPDNAPGYPDSASHSATFNVAGSYLVDFNAPLVSAPNTFTVNGTDATLDLNGNNLAVGIFVLGSAASTTATFTLTGGAQLSAATTNIAQGSSANATLNVTGAGTNLEGFSAFMANAGSPVLDINVTAGGSLTKSVAGTGTVLGNVAGANVSLLVDGTNSVLSNVNSVNMATFGTFTGTVSAGGKIEGGLINLADNSGNATLTVTGAGSQVRATTGNFVVGGRVTAPSNGTASLTIENQASAFAATQLYVGLGTTSGTTQGTLTVSGVGTSVTVGDGTSSTNAIEVGFANVASPAGPTTGNVYVLDGGLITVVDTTGAANNHLRVGYQASGPSTTTGFLRVEGSGPAAVSKINIAAGGLGLLIAQGTSTGTVEVGPYGEVNLTHATAGNITNGTATNPNGTLRLDGGTVTLPAARSLTNNGTLEGNGTISRNSGATAFTVTNNGTIQPGLSTGTLNIVNGNLSQTSAAATIKFELGYPVVEFYDRIVISGGTATISNGTLDFMALPGQKPADGVYALMTATTLTIGAGVLSAAQSDASALAGFYGGTALLQLLGSAGSGQTLQLTLSGIPEPGTTGVLAAGLVLVLRRRTSRPQITSSKQAPILNVETDDARI